VIDLVAQGPHALIGGTSGAGKSELLRAALASMALRYPPSQLTFLLVDYKGGSAFRELSELPHSVGVVTDLDEHLSVRALTSLRAEIRHRETILAEHGALDLSDLVRRRPDVAPPRLLIAIDEFATLAQEVPGFVDGVLDVVQRGRSLGVHLVLATQSPRGSVTGKIRANTALSVALRTLSRDESTDIIGTPEAAYIPRRAAGRAWVSLGGTELVPFQSGYVGGAPDAYEEERVEVVPFALGETHDVAGTIAPATEHDTELAALGRAIASAFTAGGDDLPRRPWLPEMPDRLSAAAGLQDHGRGWIGTADDPARQRTFPVVFDPAAHGHLLVLGGPRSGRTSALATTAASLAWGATTDEVQIYGLDGAGRTLGVIEALPHCGAVVTADDGPRTARLLELLTSELATRRARASQLGATDFADLRGRSADPLPRLLLLVDDFGAFSERYERAELGRLADLMRALITDGPAFGLHAVISADRRFAIPAAAQAVIGMRIVLRMTDREEYQRLGLPRAVEALDLPPGRGFDVDGLELQLSTWTREPDEPLRDALARLGSALAERGALASPPAPVRLLPEQIAASALPPADTPWHATIGVRERDLLPAVVDLRAAHFMVVGPYRSGRSTALGALVESLTQATPGLERHLVTNRPSPLADRSGWAAVHTSPTPEELAAVLEQLAAAPAGTPRAVAIDDATELDATMLNTRLEAAVRACRDAGVTILSSCEAQAVFVAYGWLRELRKDGAGLLLSPQMETHGEIFGTKLPWRRAIEFPPGRGFLVRSGGGVELVQVATI
jgi:S-DNA-T family DNA segregation ATPase FtsK/SpoIIIE